MPATIEQELAQLREQQSAMTQCLAAMGDGRWLASLSGPDSVEGWLLALNPSWAGDLRGRVPGYLTPRPPRSADIVPKPCHNFTRGRHGLPVVAIVIHTMAGTLTATDSWFDNVDSQVSAHFGVGLGGDIHQYVQLTDTAWANGILEADNQWASLVGNAQNPNYQTVSIETEDSGSGFTPVSDEQYASVLRVCRLALATYPTIKYVMGHNCISPHSRPNCPGTRWWNRRFDVLARALQLQPCT